MAIYLTGGGDQENFKQLDRYFLNHLQANTKILILPQACDQEDFDDVLERIQDCFIHKNIAQIDLAYNPQKMTWDELDEYDVLMIEGGNTFQLINEIRESSFFALLKKFAKAGKTIYADSAGAILLGSSVETAFLGDDADHDHLKLQNYRGLNIIDPWSVHAHYEPEDDTDLENLLYEAATPIITLSEPAGVLIEEGKIICMTETPVDLITFSGKERLKFEEQLIF